MCECVCVCDGGGGGKRGSYNTRHWSEWFTDFSPLERAQPASGRRCGSSAQRHWDSPVVSAGERGGSEGVREGCVRKITWSRKKQFILIFVIFNPLIVKSTILPCTHTHTHTHTHAHTHTHTHTHHHCHPNKRGIPFISVSPLTILEESLFCSVHAVPRAFSTTDDTCQYCRDYVIIIMRSS